MVSPVLTSSQLLKWLVTLITFDWNNQPGNTAEVGLLLVVVTPMIYNLKVGRVLVEGEAGLNLLSSEVFL